MIAVTCPNCGTETEVSEESGGRRVLCKQCDQWFLRPARPARKSGRTRRPRSKTARVPPPSVPAVADEEPTPPVKESEAPATPERNEWPASTKKQEKPRQDGPQRQADESEPRTAREVPAADEKALLATRGDIGRLLEQVRRIDDKLVTIRWAVIASVVVFSVACLAAIVAIVKAI